MTLFDAKDAYDDDAEEDEKGSGAGTFLLVIFALVFLVVIFVPNGKNLLIPRIAVSIFMVGMGIAGSWYLIRYIWFWCVIAIIVYLNIYMNMISTWPEWSYTKLILLPFALADYLATLGIVRVVEKIIDLFKVRNHDE